MATEAVEDADDGLPVIEEADEEQAFDDTAGAQDEDEAADSDHGDDAADPDEDEPFDSEAVKALAREMPIHNPVPGRPVSSSFGVRRDPIIRRPAMHAGIDFRAPSGTDIRSAGAGTVVKSGWNGGYGRMVEIDHGNGLTTRYAHMSKLRVKKGQTVETGDVVGEVGSSGRSTGPHLHYEVRRNGDAIDPLRFLKAGKKVSNLL